MKRMIVVWLAVAACLGAVAPAASAQSSLADPPKGANDWSCKPSKAHPNPVVLVHGLSATMGENWLYISPLLKARGYCVFALTYGLDPRVPPIFGGTIPIEQSAPELGAFVDRVLQTTGAKKVDLVGHSEGTFMPEYWLKYLGGANKVRCYVAMTPLYQGTNLAELPLLRDSAPSGLSNAFVGLVAAFCGSCPEFLAGSPMVHKLNANGGPEVPGIAYTTIMTDHDELVEPYTSGMLPPPAHNIVLQKVCPNDLDEHGAEAFDPVVARLIFNALDPRHARHVSCAGLPPLAPPPAP